MTRCNSCGETDPHRLLCIGGSANPVYLCRDGARCRDRAGARTANLAQAKKEARKTKHVPMTLAIYSGPTPANADEPLSRLHRRLAVGPKRDRLAVLETGEPTFFRTFDQNGGVLIQGECCAVELGGGLHLPGTEIDLLLRGLHFDRATNRFLAARGDTIEAVRIYPLGPRASRHSELDLP